MALRLRGTVAVRWFDSLAGRALVQGSRPLRRRRTPPPDFGTIGLLKSTAIGDTVLMSSIIGDLEAHFPKSRIVLFAGTDNAAIGRLVPGVTDVVALPVLHPVRSLRSLRSWDIDLLVDCGSWLRFESLYTAWSGARYTVGFDTPGQARAGLLDLSVRHSDQVHEVDNYRALLHGLGIPTGHPPRLVPPGELAPAMCPQAPFAVLHPWPGGARSRARSWAADRWVEVGRHLAKGGLDIVLTGSPADVDDGRALQSMFRQSGLDVADVAGTMSLPAVADLLARSSCVVSVNTGTMHMAAALGVPTVGLNGPTSARRWGPVGDRVASVNSTLPGCGFLNLGWEYHGHRMDCMDGISVAAVIEAIDHLLGAR